MTTGRGSPDKQTSVTVAGTMTRLMLHSMVLQRDVRHH